MSLNLLRSYSEAWEGRKCNEKGGHHDRQAVKSEVTPEKPKVDCGASSAPTEGSTVPSPDGSSPDAPAKKRPSLPRIFYATRTHSQIGQVCNPCLLACCTSQLYLSRHFSAIDSPSYAC